MRRWIVALAVLATVTGAVVAFRGCEPPCASAPFADRLPEDVLFYLASPDAADLVARLKSAPVPELEPLLKYEGRLRGPAALVARPGSDGLEWTAILDAGPAAALAGPGTADGWHYDTDGRRVLVAASPGTIARFRSARQARLDVAFSSGHAIVYAVPSAFPSDAWSLWCARWRDFARLSASVEFVGGGLRVRALARYAPGLWRPALEHEVHAPRRAVAPPDAVLWTTQLERFPRLWLDIRASLSDRDRALADHEVEHVKAAELLPKLGPAWGVAVDRSGALTAAVEAREDPTPSVYWALKDYGGAMRKENRAVRAESEGDNVRVNAWRAPLRFAGGRVTLGNAPAMWRDGSEYHAGTVIEVDALLRLVETGALALPCDVGRLRPLQRAAWIRRAEAWTTFTDEGAKVEGTLSFGSATGRQAR